MADVTVLLCQTEDDERRALTRLVEEILGQYDDATAIVGFNCLAYDLPLLWRRCQYLGLPVPQVRIDKYRPGRVRDLLRILSWDLLVKPHSLRFYSKRFGLDVMDTTTGADVADLVAAGNWDAVRRHCESDILLTEQLAVRLEVIHPTRPYVVLDLETVAVSEAAEYLDTIEAPSNYKDPAKIDAYLDAKRKDLLAKAALDIDLARIVAIGYAASMGEVGRDPRIAALAEGF